MTTATLGSPPLAARERAARSSLAPFRALYPFEPRFHVHGPPSAPVLQHYLDEGPPGAEPLLFLHGNPSWSFAWRGAIRALSARHRCVAPDHVGMGLSDKPRGYDYRLERHVLNLEALVLALDLERITLVLHDWGGPIGLGFARRHPERVARLVVLNTAAFRAARLPLRLAACRVPLLGTLAVQGLNAFARGALSLAVERPLAPDVKRGYLLPYDSWSHRAATRAFVEDIPLDAGHPSYAELALIEAALPDFAARPCAILWGERDWCFDASFRAEWERRFPRARVRRFETAGHWVFEDAGAELVSELASFLAEPDGPR